MISRFSGFILSVILCFALACNHTAFATDRIPATLLVLGDSLSGAWGIDTAAGWVALLQQQLAKEGYEYRVINASVSGDTTRTGLSRINAALKEHQPAFVIIALGGNDGLRGLAFTEIAAVLLAGVRLPPNYGPVYNRQFAALYQGLAERYKVPLVPRILDQVAEHRELLQEDGIHPTAQAQPQIMQNVWAGLKPMLKSGGQ